MVILILVQLVYLIYGMPAVIEETSIEIKKTVSGYDDLSDSVGDKSFFSQILNKINIKSLGESRQKAYMENLI